MKLTVSHTIANINTNSNIKFYQIYINIKISKAYLQTVFASLLPHLSSCVPIWCLEYLSLLNTLVHLEVIPLCSLLIAADVQVQLLF